MKYYFIAKLIKKLISNYFNYDTVENLPNSEMNEYNKKIDYNLGVEENHLKNNDAKNGYNSKHILDPIIEEDKSQQSYLNFIILLFIILGIVFLFFK